MRSANGNHSFIRASSAACATCMMRVDVMHACKLAQVSGSRVEVDGVGQQALEQDVVEGGAQDVVVAGEVGVPCGHRQGCQPKCVTTSDKH